MTLVPASLRTLAALWAVALCLVAASPAVAVNPAPGGRVYEKLTPADKNGGNSSFAAVIGNDRVALAAGASFLDEDPFFEDSGRYLAERTSTGWTLRPRWLAAKTGVFDWTENGSLEVVSQDGCSLCLPLTADDTDQAVDVYVRGPQGVALVSKGSAGTGGSSGDPAIYAGRSADVSHILFETVEHLEPADDGRLAGNQLYDRVNGQTRVVGILPDGTVDPGGAVLGHGAMDLSSASAGSANPISADGSKVFFESPDPTLGGNHQLYVRTNGQSTVHVSASRCDPACVDPSQPTTFQGASEDGSIVYFTTAGQLLNADTDSDPDLYQYRTDTQVLTLISQDCVASGGAVVDCGFTIPLDASGQGFGQGVNGVSADGRRIYFSAPPAPAGDYGGPVATSIWTYDVASGTTRFAAPLGSATVLTLLRQGLRIWGPLGLRMTPDGNTLLFESTLTLTTFDNSLNGMCGGLVRRCMELYRYRADTQQIDCISCNRTGRPPIGDSAAATTLWAAAATLSDIARGRDPGRIVSDDGRVIAFQSDDALLAVDMNERSDVYLWQDGELSLVTTGRGAAKSSIAGVTADGRDIFFSTYDPLVPEDRDTQADLYDARVGGGFPSPPQPQPCEGDQCQPLPEAPALVGGSVASETFVGPGNAKPKRSKPRKSCRRGYVLKRTRPKGKLGKGNQRKAKIKCVKKHGRR